MKDLLAMLEHYFWGPGKNQPTSSAAPTMRAMRDQIVALQQALAEQRAANDLRVLYCPRCCQHLPAKVFAGHLTTIYTRRDSWPGRGGCGFTSETTEYQGPPVTCPGGAAHPSTPETDRP